MAVSLKLLSRVPPLRLSLCTFYSTAWKPRNELAGNLEGSGIGPLAIAETLRGTKIGQTLHRSKLTQGKLDLSGCSGSAQVCSPCPETKTETTKIRSESDFPCINLYCQRDLPYIVPL